MNLFIRKITEYFKNQIEIAEETLKSYEASENKFKDQDSSIRKIREMQVILLRQKIAVLNKHIAIIERLG